MINELPQNLLTRRGSVDHLNAMGVPVTISTINKMSMLGTGPKPDLYYGKKELFLPSTIEKWAKEYLLSLTPTKLFDGDEDDQDAA